MKEFIFPKNILELIYQQAINEYPAESCGWILKVDSQFTYVPSKNLQDKYHKFDPISYPRTSKDAFLIDALQLSKDLDEVTKKNGILYSIVHSHINVGAYFSAEDKKQMAEADGSRSIYPAESYLVVNINEEKKADELAVFYFENKEFQEGKVIIS